MPLCFIRCCFSRAGLVLLVFVLLSCESTAEAIKKPSSLGTQEYVQRRRQNPSRVAIINAAHSNPTPPVTLDRGGFSEAILNGLKNAVASGVATTVVKSALQPFDTVKTIQQYSTTKISALEAAQVVLARSGWPGLWAGLTVVVVGAVPSVATYFGSYQYFRNTFESWGLAKSLSILAAAGLGNTLASGLRVPYETVKARLQAGVYATTGEALKTMLRQGGPGAFFCDGGVGIQILRDVPYAMVTLLVYEKLQDHLRARVPERYHGLLNPLAGGLAGGVGTWLTNPMDVVKTRVNLAPAGQYPGLAALAAGIAKNEGYGAFFKGAGPRLMHRVPANALFFVVYEFMRGVLGLRRGG